MKNKTNRLEKIWDYIYQFYLGYINRIREATRKLRDLPNTNYELGMFHLRQGNIYDAKLRFRLVLLFNSKHSMASYRLGYCYLITGDEQKAEKYFLNCLKLKPDFVEAKYMLSTIDKTQKPPSYIPISIIEEFFDDLAVDYQEERVEQRGYKGHILLLESIQTLYDIKSYDQLEMLDIGCGTGLCGVYFKERTKISFLTGIDISAHMLVQAKLARSAGKPAYDNLLKVNFNEYLINNDKKFHLIISACALHYADDLEKIIVNCKNTLHPEGIFAFSVQKSLADDICLNDKMENFCYSKSYLEKAATKAGFNNVTINEVDINDKNTVVWQFIGKNV